MLNCPCGYEESLPWELSVLMSDFHSCVFRGECLLHVPSGSYACPPGLTASAFRLFQASSPMVVTLECALASLDRAIRTACQELFGPLCISASLEESRELRLLMSRSDRFSLSQVQGWASGDGEGGRRSVADVSAEALILPFGVSMNRLACDG